MKIEHIWTQYRTSLYQFLLSRVSSPEDAEDILQDVILKSVNSIDQLNDTTKVKSWLFQVAKYSVIDYYRIKSKLNLNREASSNIEIEQKWNDDEQSLYVELEPCIQPFIQALPPAQQLMLTEIDIYGQSQKAFAESQKLPYSTLKSQLKQSRLALKQLYLQCCRFETNNKGELLDYVQHKSDCGHC
ncbi:sigma-70 family RNA polymerase sigma factor [Parashewanella curva]|uniref:Sigma-70 family RNA polymerase sigma factor n=1 Tax=Parashewanella curva TaxID=2338552 RepID=A0A3L8PWK3_9GAMM|nr:sigma-70 family RNA polymerase sigma factor [Parashewanella curva]RLV59744.1 sigma-70 family RNA polymerase sigma factor [Parashewanella curva]